MCEKNLWKSNILSKDAGRRRLLNVLCTFNLRPASTGNFESKERFYSGRIMKQHLVSEVNHHNNFLQTSLTIGMAINHSSTWKGPTWNFCIFFISQSDESCASHKILRFLATTLHKNMKFSIKDFFSKCDQIRSFLLFFVQCKFNTGDLKDVLDLFQTASILCHFGNFL